MKRIFYVITLFFSCVSLCAYSQSDNNFLKGAVAGLKTLSGDHIIEKAYLHFDKPYYAVGDTMYFKAYVTLGEHHDLSKASVVLYIDLINPNNSISNTIKLQLNDGVAWGDFLLPDSLGKGNYRVRAYTQYMQNDADYFFDQTIPVGSIVNKGISESSAALTAASKPDIQFFPEGGELASAMLSKVAFKAIGTNGLGVNIKGVIVDNTNSQVATFVSTHLGMGAFLLQPEEGKTYKAKVTFADGSQNTFDLPVPVSKGIVLAVKDTLNKISLEIRSNKAYFQENINKDINLVIYGGGLVSSVNTKLDSRRLSMDIPNSQFPSGIVKITLFSQTGEPLSERMLFLQNPDMVNLAVNSDKTSYSKRERVLINVNAKDKGANAGGHFSVSVIDESKVPVDENNETTILSYLLLTSDLKGYIEQPNYYFVNNTGESQAALDVLMLTQGYRRFAWKQLLSENVPKFTYVPEKSLEIRGFAKTSAGAPVANMDVMLLTSTSGSMLGEKTDNEGKFIFSNIGPFSDIQTFTLQATGSTKNRSTTVITVDKDKPEPAVADKNIPVARDDINKSMIPYLSNIQEQHAGLYKDIAFRAPGVNGERNADQVVQGSEIRTSTSLISALTGKLAGVNFMQGIPYLKKSSVKGPMLVVVDGKIRGSYVNLDNISPGSVAKVEVLNGSNADSYGIYGNAGVLVITSLTGNANADIAQQNDSYKYNSTAVIKMKATSIVSSKNSYRSSNLGGAGHADQVIKGSDIRNAPTLSTGLNGLLNGVNFVQGVPYLNTSAVVSNGVAISEPMYIIVDGSPVSGNIDNIYPNTVEAVEVLKGANASIYGNQGGPGVMVITTLQSLPVNENINTSYLGNLQFKPNGFYKAREFYSPRYDVQKASSRLDMRSTIFWNPEVITNKDGNASFDFYNSDGKGSYRLVIEGVDNIGNIGRQVFRYKVQ